MKTNRLFGLLQFFAALGTSANSSVGARPHVGGASGAYRSRFNLGRIPPAWKGKRQARINRGGK